jgi:hypothetical protein
MYNWNQQCLGPLSAASGLSPRELAGGPADRAGWPKAKRSPVQNSECRMQNEPPARCATMNCESCLLSPAGSPAGRPSLARAVQSKIQNPKSKMRCHLPLANLPLESSQFSVKKLLVPVEKLLVPVEKLLVPVEKFNVSPGNAPSTGTAIPVPRASCPCPGTATAPGTEFTSFQYFCHILKDLEQDWRKNVER